MNKSVSYLAIISFFTIISATSQAGPEACHEPMQSQVSSQAEEKLFKEMDTNGDGKISKAEFNAFYAKRFSELDVNKDGKLSYEELNIGSRKKAGEVRNSGTTHLDERFNAADANHDGGLDREEAKNMPMLSMYFDEVDTNHDGKVTRQEYFDAMPLLHRVKQEKADSL